MPLSSGDKLGPYEILAPIGAGGMGQVYRARDTRLGRDVALKISSERFTERILREARAIASLSHPNICALYDVGHQDGIGELTAADVALEGREQPSMEGLEEVPGLQIVADPLEGGVVVEERAQQRLFGLDVGRGMGDRHLVGHGTQVERWNESHGLPIA